MNSRPSAAAVLAIAFLAVFTVWITWRAKALETGRQAGAQTVKIEGKPAPDFSLPAIDGRSVSLADYRGKQRVVVTFWASWCGPCRVELPLLAQVYERAHTANGGFEVVAISVDDDRNAAADYARQAKLPFPVLLDPGQKTVDPFRVESIPTVFLIDTDGKVSFGRAGFDQRTYLELAQRLGVPVNFPFGVGGGRDGSPRN